MDDLATTEKVKVETQISRPHDVTWVPDSIIDDTTLAKNEVLTYLALARHANRQGNCHPALKTLEREARLTWRSLSAALKSLQERNMIRVTHRYDEHGKQHSNRYELTSETVWKGIGTAKMHTPEGYQKRITKDSQTEGLGRRSESTTRLDAIEELAV